jgi:tRNA A-37 threonylcarbamoyl transferase component Bud32
VCAVVRWCGGACAVEQEARCLVKGRAAGVCTPAVFFVDHPTKRLYIEHIEGQAVKHFLFARGTQSPGTYLLHSRTCAHDTRHTAQSLARANRS